MWFKFFLLRIIQRQPEGLPLIVYGNHSRFYKYLLYLFYIYTTCMVFLVKIMLGFCESPSVIRRVFLFLQHKGDSCKTTRSGSLKVQQDGSSGPC